MHRIVDDSHYNEIMVCLAHGGKVARSHWSDVGAATARDHICDALLRKRALIVVIMAGEYNVGSACHKR